MYIESMEDTLVCRQAIAYILVCPSHIFVQPCFEGCGKNRTGLRGPRKAPPALNIIVPARIPPALPPNQPVDDDSCDRIRATEYDKAYRPSSFRFSLTAL